MHKNHGGVKLLPDPREAGLHLGFQFSYICMFVSLDQNLLPTNSKGQGDKETKGRRGTILMWHATSLDKKIMQPFWTKKMTQPLGTRQKMHKLSQQKKHATSWDKKITQPHGTKQSHATVWDKKQSHNLWGGKKSCNLSGHKKNHATSWEKTNHATFQNKNITQPLMTKNQATSRDKNNSRNLLGQKKSCNL